MACNVLLENRIKILLLLEMFTYIYLHFRKAILVSTKKKSFGILIKTIVLLNVS